MLHDARHSFAVRQVQAGVDPNLIACNLGHVDGSLVMRVYDKLRPKPAEFGCSLGCSEAHAAIADTA